MKRKIFSLFLILIMGMVFSPIVHAETKPDGAEWLVDKGENHVWYKIEGTTLTIGGSGEMPDWDFSPDAGNPLSFLNTPWRDKDTHYFKNITKIEIKEGITKIGNNSFSLAKSSTFSDTSTIEEVVLPESLESIGNNAFKLNTTLESIKFPSKLHDIGSAAFQDCGLKEVVLPESLETLIKGGAFLNNGSLEKVTLPSKLARIGTQTFNGCTSLNTIVSYNTSAPTLDANAFKNTSISNITIPSGSLDSYETSWNIDITSVTVKYIYTITFNKNDGTENVSKMVLQGNKLDKPTDPTKSGYTFNGWFTDEFLTEPFDFDTPINKNVTLYAKWEDKTYTYEFIDGDDQYLSLRNIKQYVLEIDGDYLLFDSLKIGDLDLIKDEDYTISEGSTIITFTENGITKLNSLKKGEYEVTVKYSNSKEVKGTLNITDISNPQTGDNAILYIILLFICTMFGTKLVKKTN